MLLYFKKRIELLVRDHPRLFANMSKAYYKVNRRFETLSPGAPGAIREAFEHSLAGPLRGEGDYYEFGVFRGYAFWSAQESCKALGLLKPNFYGFDSFAGLPKVEGIDRTNNQFFEGQFACSKNEVERHLTKRGVDWSRTTLIEGMFSDSLTDETKRNHPFREVAVALIDCDLYSSTTEVLTWLKEYVADGSILLFDDWYSYGTDPNLGQQRAFGEFLQDNPCYTAEPFVEFEDHGKGFVIRRS